MFFESYRLNCFYYFFALGKDLQIGFCTDDFRATEHYKIKYRKFLFQSAVSEQNIRHSFR